MEAKKQKQAEKFKTFVKPTGEMISIRKSQPIPTGIIQVQSCKLDAIQEEDEEEG